jgi:predicted anti-sigma-YlaC factor YlaD
MNDKISEHLSEDQLLEFATGTGNIQIQEHLDICQQCSKTVNEFHEVSNALRNLNEEDVPSSLEKRILNSLYSKRSGITKILESPFLTTIIAVVIIFLLYVMIGTLITEQ